MMDWRGEGRVIVVVIKGVIVIVLFYDAKGSGGREMRVSYPSMCLSV